MKGPSTPMALVLSTTMEAELEPSQ